MTLQDLFVVGLALVGLIMFLLAWAREGYRHLRWRHKIRHHPLDPALRPLVASDMSWEHGALRPDFFAEVLPAYRFLTDEFGFDLPRLVGEPAFAHYRRGNMGLVIQEAYTDKGREIGVEFQFYQTEHSFRIVNRIALGSKSHGLGDGFADVAEYVRASLERYFDELKEAV
jgi:hypothetical protein